MIFIPFALNYFTGSLRNFVNICSLQLIYQNVKHWEKKGLKVILSTSHENKKKNSLFLLKISICWYAYLRSIVKMKSPLFNISLAIEASSYLHLNLCKCEFICLQSKTKPGLQFQVVFCQPSVYLQFWEYYWPLKNILFLIDFKILLSQFF